MNKMVLASTMLVSLFAANSMAASAPIAGSANAAASTSKATAQVDFKGEIVASTCVVNSNASDQAVTLPTVNDQQFGTAAGNTIGDTAFKLAFSGCTTAANHTYSVVFSGTTPSGNNTKVLEVVRAGSAGPVTDVGIQVTDKSGNKVDFAPGSAGLPMTDDASGNLTLDLIAKYEQLTTALPAAGKITASMNYTVIYK